MPRINTTLAFISALYFARRRVLAQGNARDLSPFVTSHAESYLRSLVKISKRRERDVAAAIAAINAIPGILLSSILMALPSPTRARLERGLGLFSPTVPRSVFTRPSVRALTT
jgi:hypothetical protein